MNDETEQPESMDRITIEKRTMLALEKIAVALEKLNLDKYKTTKQVVRGHHETWHQGSGHPTANKEDCPWCNP